MPSPSGVSAYVAGVDRYTNSNFDVYNRSAIGASIGTPYSAMTGKSTNEYAVLH